LPDVVQFVDRRVAARTREGQVDEDPVRRAIDSIDDGLDAVAEVLANPILLDVSQIDTIHLIHIEVVGLAVLATEVGGEENVKGGALGLGSGEDAGGFLCLVELRRIVCRLDDRTNHRLASGD